MALRVLLLSPYHGGSHEAWAQGLQRHCAHEIEISSLPARFWKWRMHGGAVTLARRFLENDRPPDVIMATDMLDLSTFLALTRSVTANVSSLLYMHENQLTYPLPDDPEAGPMRRQRGERDQHYGFVNYASMLAADRIVFNSDYHRRSLFDELPRFLRHFPEHNELGSVEHLEARSSVIPVGIDVDGLAAGGGNSLRPDAGGVDPEIGSPDAADEPPLVIWNQRWEYDKNPVELFEALRVVADRGVPFRLALCGESFSRQPPEFDAAEQTFGSRLVHMGFAPPDVYRRLLQEATLTASTARHEFLGVAVLEAMACGTMALLPNRLSYPELLNHPALADATRRRCIYDSLEDLVDGLEWGLRNPAEARRVGSELAAAARRFDWTRIAPAYDEMISTAARR